MTNIRLPRAVCATVASVLRGSHATLESLFEAAGAPGPPPALSHGAKWKDWLFRAGNDPDVDSLAVLGGVLEEFMDLGPDDESEDFSDWKRDRDRVVKVLEENGFRYYRGGRVLPSGQLLDPENPTPSSSGGPPPAKPSSIDELLTVLLKGLPRAMHPLTHRRKGAASLSFTTEYDVQDLLHALLRPWVADIRPEEFTPSYAGSNTRMDFLLPDHSCVIELKFVRDRRHAKKIGDELIIDIDHYSQHRACKTLWGVVYDPGQLLPNAGGPEKRLTRYEINKERYNPRQTACSLAMLRLV